MSIKGNLWEVTFIVEGVHLPQDQIIVGDHFRFEKLSEEESRGMWLPARCVVKVRGSSQEAEALAKRYLQDFLGIYSVIGNIAPRNLFFKEARRIKGRVPEEKGKVVDHIVSMGVIRMVPDWSIEKSSGILNVSEEIRNRIDLNSARNFYLRISLGYLRYAGEVDRKEDKLINCMIALEALYLKQIQELSYRLSHRATSLLGDTDKKRSTIFKNVRDLYVKRSKVVHGDPASLSWDDIKLARAYLRESIKRFLALSQQYSREDIIDTLDLAIVNSQIRGTIQKKSKRLFEERWGTINDSE